MAVNHGICQPALGLLQVQNPLLQRPLGNDLVHRHVLGLANAVRAVRGLVLRGGVPPGVRMQHDAGPRQVEPRATRLEADQEDRRVIRVEGVHQLQPVLLGG